ncbi:hypothetical protein FSC37_23150 [Piscinibacter aquaticus]|uniref:DNA binding HTH domain-containing protein n=1 Tax=Piscinibacter aquaticus TaxID=392597 RepID=A0A5C6TPB8_9BURK|nr:hypothetical protein FSC37_23150 [Piscinibacter aquaticus]
MSSKKMFGLLPPRSSVAGIRLPAAACAITRPVAARRLGISRNTLYRKLGELGPRQAAG